MNGGCTCECHVRPGVYPTSEARPCGVCGHVDAHGQWVCGAWGPHGNYRPADANTYDRDKVTCKRCLKILAKVTKGGEQ